MKKPTEDQLLIAAEWLRYNEGEDGESVACLEAADWIDSIVTEDAIRAAAKSSGIPAKDIRERMRLKGLCS